MISALILQEQMTLVQTLGGVLLLGSTFVSEIRLLNSSKQFISKTPVEKSFLKERAQAEVKR